MYQVLNLVVDCDLCFLWDFNRSYNEVSKISADNVFCLIGFVLDDDEKKISNYGTALITKMWIRYFEVLSLNTVIFTFVVLVYKRQRKSFKSWIFEVCYDVFAAGIHTKNNTVEIFIVWFWNNFVVVSFFSFHDFAAFCYVDIQILALVGDSCQCVIILSNYNFTFRW